jgi:hypothetical protein
MDLIVRTAHSNVGLVRTMRYARLSALAILLCVFVLGLSCLPQPGHADVGGLSLTYVWVFFQETNDHYLRYNGTSGGSLQLWEYRCTMFTNYELDCGGSVRNVILNATVFNSRMTSALDVVIQVDFMNHTLLSEPFDVPARASERITQTLAGNDIAIPRKDIVFIEDISFITVNIKSARFLEATTTGSSGGTTIIDTFTLERLKSINVLSGIVIGLLFSTPISIYRHRSWKKRK